MPVPRIKPVAVDPWLRDNVNARPSVPVQQPYARVDYIPQSGIYEFGYWAPNDVIVRKRIREKKTYLTARPKFERGSPESFTMKPSRPLCYTKLFMIEKSQHLKYNFILPLLCTSRNDIYTCSLGEITRSRETGGLPDIFRPAKNRRCQK